MRPRGYGVGDERCRSQHRVPNGGEPPGRDTLKELAVVTPQSS